MSVRSACTRATPRGWTPASSRLRAAYIPHPPFPRPVNELPVGVLEGTMVVVADERWGNQLHNKGSHGTPMSGGGLELSLLEAAYLVEADRMRVERAGGGGNAVTLEDLIAAGGAGDPAFGVRYVVYRDLRERGYVVRPSTTPGVDLEVFPRGESVKAGDYMWMLAVSERASFATSEFLALLHRAEALGRRLLIGVVDEEGDVTHYRAQLREMRGGLPTAAPEGPELGGWAFDDRVVTFELGSADALAPPGHLGRRLGGAHQLSLIEAAWLARAGRLRLRDATTGEALALGDLVARARARQPDFDLRLRVYSDLRERGLVAKTGFKYGTHFRAYEEDPEGHHARFLVHAVPRDHETSWPELSRAVRLAHGVRKEMVFGAAGEQGVEYLKIRRVRP